MKTSIPRLRRVRFKNGRTLEVLRPGATDPAFMIRGAVENPAMAVNWEAHLQTLL